MQKSDAQSQARAEIGPSRLSFDYARPPEFAIEVVRDRVTWGPEWGNSPFFDGEVKPCINGRVVSLGAYFDVRSETLVDRLLGEQLPDGGWNCDAESGSVRSSFHTTIYVLEGLLAFEQAFGASAAIRDVRHRAEEYLLTWQLMRRLSDGAIGSEAWNRFAFPPLWHYDVLRGLDWSGRQGCHQVKMLAPLTLWCKVLSFKSA